MILGSKCVSDREHPIERVVVGLTVVPRDPHLEGTCWEVCPCWQEGNSLKSSHQIYLQTQQDSPSAPV